MFLDYSRTPVNQETERIIDPVEGDITALYFCYMESDPETIIPEGTHEINDTWFDGTVLASTGMEWDGSVIPSYYAGYTDGWLVEPYYFFQTGTGVENINVNQDGVKKQLIDGQLVIIRDGKAYNAIGAQVK